ncbi:rhodanese-like domain-containing protein [Pontibacter sp. HSC-14F20]|uniref:rhodanese-like domain-containing protein n=1 Tax=Pontibacter sp. HSC-14F20 TaxID=2864136 RepID=UPI001C73191E|nr:rhodanese-like domain-containing protein [Pontibacter sp. HSC-14F20]MBX0332519.1 rhodanese-like domain-containing protein [Pontibacter sp. HSC-14F20]
MRYTWHHRLYLTLSLCLLLSACKQPPDAAYHLMLRQLYSHSVDTISVARVQQQLEQGIAPLLLDTRSKSEYEVSHLPGARYVGYADFDLSDLKDVPPNTPLVIYCAVGYRSEKIGEQLQAAGYTNVRNLYGGLFEWVNHSLPVYNEQGQTTKVHGYTRAWGIWLREGEKVYD